MPSKKILNLAAQLDVELFPQTKRDYSGNYDRHYLSIKAQYFL